VVAASFQYRRDIDGLRAVAIVPVVLFHAGVPGIGGGFVGVDVFFVISGFLITSIIAEEMRQGTFSLAGFYERRMRRLLPTLFTVLAAVYIAALVLLVPQDLRQLAHAIVAALGFAANFYYGGRGGYFDDRLEQDPLLHTWSLAVEEQFYIAWPLLLLVLLPRLRRSVLAAVLLVLLVVSFAAATAGVAAQSTRVFFDPHPRAWELLVGCVLALGLVPPPRSQPTANVASVAGLTAILAAVVLISSDTPFPGPSALLPVGGAALVIWSGMNGTVLGGRLLSLSPFVFIGLISYAWYLWHWPMFAYFNYAFDRAADGFESVAIILVSALLAFLSWRYLERPVRRRDGGFGRRTVLVGATTGAIAFALLSLLARTSDGFAGRFPDGMRAYLPENIERTVGMGRRCSRLDAATIRRGELCAIAKAEEARGGVLLWGDSHAGAVAPAFASSGAQAGLPVWYASQGACPPLLGVDQKSRPKSFGDCWSFNEAMAAAVEQLGVTDVVLAARWNAYAEGPPPIGPDKSSPPTMIADGSSATYSLEENRNVLVRGLKRTTEILRKNGVRVWVLAQVPYAGVHVPRHLSKLLMRGKPVSPVPGLDPAFHAAQSRFTRELFEEMERKGLARVIDPAPAFCGRAPCLVERDGKPLYFDDDHVSGVGAELIRERLAPIFAAADADRSLRIMRR